MSSDPLYEGPSEHLPCLEEKTNGVERINSRSYRRKDPIREESRGQVSSWASQPGCQYHDGDGPADPNGPAALTFWDSNYRSESFIPESWGHPWVQFHLSSLVVQLALRQLKRNGLEIQTACISLIVSQPTCLLLDVGRKFRNAGQQAFHRQGSGVRSLIFSFLYCEEDRSSKPRRNRRPCSFQTLLLNNIELRSSVLWDFCYK